MTTWAIDLKKPGQNDAYRAALQHLRQQTGVVLADEVGCGKTFEALATLAYLACPLGPSSRQTASTFRALIICKRPLVDKWHREVSVARSDSSQEYTQDRFLDYLAHAGWPVDHPFIQACREAVVLASRGQVRTARAERTLRSDRQQEVHPGIYIVTPRLMSEKGIEHEPWMARFLSTAWDAIILDEAHHAAKPPKVEAQIFGGTTPEYSGKRIQLAPGGRIIALTATPFDLDPWQLANLLNVVRADPAHVEALRTRLDRYAQALQRLYEHRNRGAAGRAAHIEELAEIRSGGTYGGLEGLLRRYMIRNRREDGLARRYVVVERQASSYALRPFEKMGNLQELLQASPLLPFTGPDALLYLDLRSLVHDRQTGADAPDAKRSFVATELRQGLSSYPQLVKSALVTGAASSTRGQRIAGLLRRWTRPASERLHPKVIAVLDQVTDIARAEIIRFRGGEVATPAKIVVFNRMIRGTARHLREHVTQRLNAVFRTAADEALQERGLASAEAVMAAMRQAIRGELEVQSASRGWSIAVSDPDLLEAMHLHLRAEEDPSTDAAETVQPGPERLRPQSLAAFLRNRLLQRVGSPLTLLRCAANPEGLNPVDWCRKHLLEPRYAAMDHVVQLLRSLPDEQDPANWDARQRVVNKAVAALANLSGELFTPQICARFDGMVEHARRELVCRAFNDVDAPYVLLVSSIGEEGIDLQSWASHIIHYDVEWNPARMEQREGRVDRIGRRDAAPDNAITVRFLLLKGTYEERIFSAVMRRDQWFQVLIGAQKRALGTRCDDIEQDNVVDDVEDAPEGTGEESALSDEEVERISIDLRPRQEA